MCPVQHGKASLKGSDSVRGLPLLGAMTAHPCDHVVGGNQEAHVAALLLGHPDCTERDPRVEGLGLAALYCWGDRDAPGNACSPPQSSQMEQALPFAQTSHTLPPPPLLPVPGRPSFPLSRPSLGASLKSRFPQQSCGEDQLLRPPGRCLPESPTPKALRSGPVIPRPGLGAPRPPRHPPWSLSSTHPLIPGSQPPPQWLQEFKWLSLEDSGENCFHVALSAQAPGGSPAPRPGTPQTSCAAQLQGAPVPKQFPHKVGPGRRRRAGLLFR